MNVKRLVLVLCALCAIACAPAKADSLCVGGGLRYPQPFHGPHTVTVGPYCVPIP